jgi:uncharacterized protein (UPF0332 family)
MDEAKAKSRWKTSQELFQAADAVFKQEYYRACVGLVYYACFQAMWVALGDPPLGEWRHGGITRRFCHGQWRNLLLLQQVCLKSTSVYWPSMSCGWMLTIERCRFHLSRLGKGWTLRLK